MVKDKYAGFASTPDSPATSVQPILPDDETDLVEASIALNVATSGTVRVTSLSGTVSDVFIAAGTAFPLRVRRVWASGTTATGIRALY